MQQSNNPDDVAWNEVNSNKQTHPVGQKLPNELGLFDMSGNVQEWCSDWYGDYSAEAQTNPTGPEMGPDRVMRGGDEDDEARYCRVSRRFNYSPGYWLYHVGFRLVLSL